MSVIGKRTTSSTGSMKPFELGPEEFPVQGSLFQTLTEDEKAFLISQTRADRFEKGELIHAHCGNCIGIIYMMSGRACATMLSDEGREAVLFRLAEGDLCILSVACILRQVCLDVHLETETDASLLIVPTGTVERLMNQNSDFRCELYRLAAVRFSDVLQNLQQMLFGSVEKRILSVLTEEVRISGSNEVRLTHEQLARYTGSAREVITRALKKMSKEGTVSLQRGKIILREKLPTKALSCYLPCESEEKA